MEHIIPALAALHRRKSAEMRAARERLTAWTKPVQVMFSDGDPILGGAAKFFRRLFPTAADQPEITIRGAGHFLQEEKGAEIAAEVIAFIERAPNCPLCPT